MRFEVKTKTGKTKILNLGYGCFPLQYAGIKD